ncbi:hypothetical protein B0H13DRAFT_2358755 [Mycena leptocephala]|nr:hypothetical protein B0H13DRAFT_2358755 [Mycena leptocephala]
MLWAEEENPHQMEVCSGNGLHDTTGHDAAASSYGADLWAFGVVLYEWLTERRPVFNDNTWVFTYQQPLRFESWAEIADHPVWTSWQPKPA